MITPEAYKNELKEGILSERHCAALLCAIEHKERECLSRLRILDLKTGQYVERGRQSSRKRLETLHRWKQILLEQYRPVARTVQSFTEGIRQYPGQPEAMHWTCWHKYFANAGDYEVKTVTHEISQLVFRIDSRTFLLEGLDKDLPEIPWLEEEEPEEVLSSQWLNRVMDKFEAGELRQA